LKMN
jgi:hypothetical protein